MPIDQHYIKEILEDGTIRISFMPSSQQTAYIFTKELLRLDFDSFVSKLGIIDVYAPT